MSRELSKRIATLITYRRRRGAVFGDPNSYADLGQKLAASAFKSAKICDDVLALLMTTGLTHDEMFQSVTGKTRAEYLGLAEEEAITGKKPIICLNLALAALARGRVAQRA